MLRKLLVGTMLGLLGATAGCGGNEEAPTLVKKDREAVQTLMRRGPKGMQALEEQARQEQQDPQATRSAE